MKEKFLPIGTVVLLKGATKRIMITGYCSSIPEDVEKLYDYVGCLFPEGNLAGDQVALFDHDQIGTIVYSGLVDDEFNKFNIQVRKIASGEISADEIVESPAQSTEPLIDYVNMPPLTPDSIGKIINAIKVSEGQNMAHEPTAFDVEKMSVPKLKVPKLEGGKTKEENISTNFAFEEYKEAEVPTVEADGTPVLQLQLIGGNTSEIGNTPVPSEEPSVALNLFPIEINDSTNNSEDIGKL